MKLFGEVSIYLENDLQDKFFNTIEESLKNGWSRDKDREQEANNFLGKWYVFICEEKSNREKAALFITQSEDNLLRISNIVPKNKSMLSKDEYNHILDEFYSSFIAPIAEHFNADVKVNLGIQTIENLVSEETAKKLKNFSICANKSTGSSHPCDEERWYDFIISYVINKDNLDIDTLELFLQEDGWSLEVANRLVIEFEQEVGLLRYCLEK